MKPPFLPVRAGALALSFIFALRGHAQPEYALIDIGSLPGHAQSYATAINASRQVAGYSFSNYGLRHGFLYADGRIIDLDVGRGQASEARAINATGTVAGIVEFPSSPPHAFLWSNGSMAELVPPGASYSSAFGLTDAGTVVGASSIGGFAYVAGMFTSIGSLGGDPASTEPRAVNATGVVVGRALTRQGDNHAFLSQDGVMRDIGTLPGGSGYSAAYALNASGVVVGFSNISTPGSRAFAYQSGVMTALPTAAGGEIYNANGINSAGTIVGDYSTSDSRRAFIYRNGTINDLNLAATLPAGWTLNTAAGINDEGSIAGTMYHPVQGAKAFLLVPLTIYRPRPMVLTHPDTRVVPPGVVTTFTATGSAEGDAPLSYQWNRNGVPVPNGDTSSLRIEATSAEKSGLYTLAITSGSTVMTNEAILGLDSVAKIVGAGNEVGSNILHPNLNIFDQVLLDGNAAGMRADPGQVLRVSFVDLTDDIVQVEFSGAGMLTIVLDGPTGPATATNYNQPAISYMRGHAGLVVANADETTHISIFSVGRATAVNQALFLDNINYDGIADIAFLAIHSRNGRCGSVRAANASFVATNGLAGIYAPGVQFDGPVYIGDIQTSGFARGAIVLGGATDVRITGGDLLQPNATAITVRGISQLRFTAGSTSHGTSLPARANRGRLEQDGVDITTQIVVNP